jgi:hypothetical protein
MRYQEPMAAPKKPRPPRKSGNPDTSPWRSTPFAKRRTPGKQVFLGPGDRKRLDRIARHHGGNDSAAVRAALRCYEAHLEAGGAPVADGEESEPSP